MVGCVSAPHAATYCERPRDVATMGRRRIESSVLRNLKVINECRRVIIFRFSSKV